MQDSGSFYDLFFIYHPEDFDFARQLADRLIRENLSCRLDENIGESQGESESLREGLLRAHTVAIVLTPHSAGSQLCNELIEFAVANNKRFISLIVNEDFDVDVHPAIAANDYLFFRENDDHSARADSLRQLLTVDAHLRLHTELIVRAHAWEQAGQSNEGLLSPEEAEEARQWLANGAHRHPKPTQPLVEFIHASRQQKPASTRGLSRIAILGIAGLIILVAAIALLSAVTNNRATATATAEFLSISAAETREALSVAGTEAADSGSAASVISRLAATSARIRDAYLSAALAHAEATATQAAASTAQAAELRATKMAQLQREVAEQAVIDGAKRALDAGDFDLAMALAWEAAQTHDSPIPALNILRQAADNQPPTAFDDIAAWQISPTGQRFALLPHTADHVRVYEGPTAALIFSIDDHASAIKAMAFSHDGLALATAAENGAVIVSASEDGALLHRLDAHQGRARAIAMHPLSDRMLTAGEDPSLSLWDIESGERLASAEFDGEDGFNIVDLLVSADGTRVIAWAERDGRTVMSQYDGETLAPLPSDADGPVYRGYHPNGALAYSGGRSLPAYPGDPNTGDLRFWNTSTGQQISRVADGFNWSLISAGSISAATDTLLYIAIHEQTALLGIENSTGTKRAALVSIDNGTVLRSFENPLAASLQSAQFLDENRILSATVDGRVILWSAVDGGLIREIGSSAQDLIRVEADSRGAFALGQADDGTVYRWSLESAAGMRTLGKNAVGTSVNQAGSAILVVGERGARLQTIDSGDILLRDDDSRLARMNDSGSHFALADERDISLFSAEDGTRLASWSHAVEGLKEMFLSASGEGLIALDDAGGMWLLRSGEEAASPLEASGLGPALTVKFSARGERFLTLHPQGTLLWEEDSNSPAGAIALGLAPDSVVKERIDVAFNRAGDELVFFALLDDGLAALTVIDLDAASLQRRAFADVAFGALAEDGKYLLLSLADDGIHIIDVASGQVIQTITNSGHPARQLRYQAENDRLFAAIDDSLLVWDVPSQSLIQRMRHPTAVVGFSVSQNGERVLSADSDGVYRSWHVESPRQLLRRIEERFAPRELSCAERERYLALPLCE